MKIWDDMLAILKAPVVGELDTLHLFLVTGLVLVMLAAWALIFDHIRMAAQEIS